MFNVTKFCRNYHIHIANTGKHVRPGWVNISCPFCNGQDHLGVHLSSGAVKCWRCGPHSQLSVIKALLGCDYETAKAIHEEYESRNLRSTRSESDKQGKTHATVCSWPEGTNDLSERGCSYLRRRGFDPERLKELWGLRETGMLGDYKFRIIAPIIVDGVMVSYQGRDYTGKSELRYKACKQVNEVIEHQSTVYGLDHAKGGSCVIVEGIVDVWRFGYGSVSCFGTAFTLAQVNLIASRFKKVFIIFDADDDNAMAMANELACLLSARGVEVEIVDISDTPLDCLVDPKKGIDPGNLQQWYADEILKELGL